MLCVISIIVLLKCHSSVFALLFTVIKIFNPESLAYAQVVHNEIIVSNYEAVQVVIYSCLQSQNCTREDVHFYLQKCKSTPTDFKS